MITLRILLTGLIAYGPMYGINQETKDIWALMARADTGPFPHETQIRFGCDVDGLNCDSAKTLDLAGYDLRILVDDKPLRVDKGLRIDYSFREFMGNLDELAGNNSHGHHACTGLVTARRLPRTRKPLETLPQLLQPISGKTIPDNIDKIASRLHLTGGFPQVSGRCGGKSHCGGKLAARDVAVCGLWKFPVSPNPRCTRLADTVVYELQVEAADLRFALVSHADGAIKKTPDNLVGSKKVVEVWVVNAPTAPPSNFKHFQHLYDLFKDGQLPKASIPTYNANGIAQCSDLPGLRPVKCPGTVF